MDEQEDINFMVASKDLAQKMAETMGANTNDHLVGITAAAIVFATVCATYEVKVQSAMNLFLSIYKDFQSYEEGVSGETH